MATKAKAGRANAGRVRWQLLALLWVWAGCVALVLDLFLNVDEFDGVRPRAPLYRAMRAVAHEMVGERLDDDLGGAPSRQAHASRDAGPRVAPEMPFGARPASSRHPGGRPDLRTPQGARLYEGLRRAATGTQDLAKRKGAMRSLAAMFGEPARPVLLEAACDMAQPVEVRDLARQLANRPAAPTATPAGAMPMMPAPGAIR